MSEQKPLYLQPGSIGRLELPNRLVRGATSETMADDETGEVFDSFVDLYRSLAAGGAGLLLSGHMYVEVRGKASAMQTGIHHDGCVAGLRRATEAVHAEGGRIFAEIGHCGSQAMLPGARTVAPSTVANPMYAVEPEELSADAVEDLVAAFGAAARRAVEAGFDGIHIHGGNGYLISAFASPYSNTRSDDWGGDAHRRGRFFREVVKAVRAEAGEGFPVTARIGVEDSVPDGLRRGESLERSRELADLGVDGFETTFGIMRSYLQNIRRFVAVGGAQAVRNLVFQRLVQPPGEEAYYREFGRAVKQATGLPVLLVGGVRTTHTMTDLIRSGDADFMVLCRPFIREPDLPLKLAAGREGGVECVSCNMCLVHDGYDPLRCWRKSPVAVGSHLWRHYVRNRPGH